MKVYLHGNCQTTVINKMLTELELDLDIKSREVHVIDIEKDMDEYMSDVRQADFIFTQTVKRDYRCESRLSSQWIHENKRSGAHVFTFPSIYFQGYTPSIFYLRPHDALGMPYHDLHIVDFVCNGLPANEIIARLVDPDFLSPAFAMSEMMLSITELRKREAELDISAANVVEKFYQREALFHTVNHPSRQFFNHLLPQVLDCLSVRASLSQSGRDYLAGTVVPPYPSIVRGIKLNYQNPYAEKAGQETYRCTSGFLSRAQYISGVVEHYTRDVTVNALASAVRDNAAATSYLARYRASLVT